MNSLSLVNPACGTTLGHFVKYLCSHTQPYLEGGDNAGNPFFLKHTPPIALADFAERLHQYFACSRESFVVSGLYLMRLYSRRPDLFNMQSAHKLMLTALTVGAKFTDDITCKQKHYARCGGIEVEELNTLEAFLLSSISFHAFVTEEEYDAAAQYISHILSDVPLKKVPHQQTVHADCAAQPNYVAASTF